MTNKEKVLNKIKKEYEENYKYLSNSSDDKMLYHTMNLIIDHIENNYFDDENEVLEYISICSEPLKALYEIFVNYIDLDTVFEKVFKDFFIKGQSHRTAFKECIFCDEFYLDDDFCDEDFEDDEEDF